VGSWDQNQLIISLSALNECEGLDSLEIHQTLKHGKNVPSVIVAGYSLPVDYIIDSSSWSTQLGN